MTIQEWKKLPPQKRGYSHYNEARKKFPLCKLGNKIVLLHHLNPGCNDYELWNPVIPMFKWCHAAMHSKMRKGMGKYGIAYVDNPKEYGKRLYAANPELFKQRSQNWRASHPEQVREDGRKRRASLSDEKRKDIAVSKRIYDKEYKSRRRANETLEERNVRRAKDVQRQRAFRESETQEQREVRLAKARVRSGKWRNKNREKHRQYSRDYRKRKSEKAV
jgi:hypothetical protein